MHVNWQSPFPLDGLRLAPLAPAEAAAREAQTVVPGGRAAAHDRFVYWLIFAVCLSVFAWVGLIERCNPLYWSARRTAARGSLWSHSKRSAHHCATLAFQG
jgi:hypothetical protein